MFKAYLSRSASQRGLPMSLWLWRNKNGARTKSSMLSAYNSITVYPFATLSSFVDEKKTVSYRACLPQETSVTSLLISLHVEHEACKVSPKFTRTRRSRSKSLVTSIKNVLWMIVMAWEELPKRWLMLALFSFQFILMKTQRQVEVVRPLHSLWDLFWRFLRRLYIGICIENGFAKRPLLLSPFLPSSAGSCPA